MARQGIPLGPPDLTGLNLPLDVEVALHNALYDRGILTHKDARRRGQEVASCLMVAFKVSVHDVLNLYLEESNGS